MESDEIRTIIMQGFRDHQSLQQIVDAIAGSCPTVPAAYVLKALQEGIEMVRRELIRERDEWNRTVPKPNELEADIWEEGGIPGGFHQGYSTETMLVMLDLREQELSKASITTRFMH